MSLSLDRTILMMQTVSLSLNNFNF